MAWGFWRRHSVQLTMLISAATVWLSCVGRYASNTSHALRLDSPRDNRHVVQQDYPRDPGSFCALNPEGCPPVPPAAPAVPTQPTPFNLDACLKACEAGGAVLESYCRGLQETWQRRLCWSVV